MIKTLLSALSQGAQTLGNTPAMPDLSAYLTEAPAVQEIAVSGRPVRPCCALPRALTTC